ncbi:MAG: NADPH-dependent oxidoreductase [Planctomycetota bacterium]|nr:MAG: NADPH-dependent oxidoreductase [Planctomycetota bacterium]
MHLAIVIGTNRAGSLSARLAASAAQAYEKLEVSVDLMDLEQVLSPDFLAPTAYKQPSPAVTAAVDRFLAADGVVFVVPEYNGSYPGALKLFIDMLPYPAGFDNRPCAFIGLAAGRFASLRAVEHFQQVAGYRNALQFPRRVLISDSYQQFDANGLKDPELAQRLAEQASGFVDFVKVVGGKAAKTR